MCAPPAPFVPEAARGKPVVGIVICWTGEHEEGERVVAPLREAAQPVVDLVGPMPYAALQSMLDEGGPHGTRAYMKAEFLEELTDEVIEKLMSHGLRPARAHGADPDRADGRRDRARRRGGDRARPARRAVVLPRARAVAGARAGGRRRAHRVGARPCRGPRADTTSGVYLNYTSDEGTERVRSSYGTERDERLVELKDRYDPANLFALNQNIRPSTPARE